VGCSQNASNSPAGRIEEWVPLTGGNNYLQGHFARTVWSAIGAKTAFANTCECAISQDNGAGISWNFTIPAAGSATYSHITTFSPTGKEALQTTKVADSATTPAGGQNGYTITVSNPNPDAVTLSSITDTLPAGFAYVAGSAQGVTTSNPTGSQTLTWAGPFTVPSNGSVTLSFDVTVSSAAGDYLNEAGGTAADGFTVLGTGPTAKITVTAGPTADLAIAIVGLARPDHRRRAAHVHAAGLESRA
jgi:uncharacterized repeat protein (TIGR01451 family)